MSDTLLMAVVFGGLLLTMTMIGAGVVMMRAQTARYRKRLQTVTGEAARRAAKSGGPGGRGDHTGARRRQIQGKLKELEDQRKKTENKKTLQNLLLEANLKTTTKKFYIFSLVFGVGDDQHLVGRVPAQRVSRRDQRIAVADLSHRRDARPAQLRQRRFQPPFRLGLGGIDIPERMAKGGLLHRGGDHHHVALVPKMPPQLGDHLVPAQLVGRDDEDA